MTADPIAPDPNRVGNDARSLTVSRRRPLREPPKSDFGDRYGRGGAGGWPGHPDAFGHTQGAAPAVRAADARLHARCVGRAPPTAPARRPPIIVYSPPVEAVTHGVRRSSPRSPSRRSRAGPGDAVRAAMAAVPEDATEILVLNGDVPLVTGVDLEAILEARRADDAAIALASVFAADPAELGRVVRGEFGTVERIVEAKDATADELAGNETNAGLYAFDAALAASPDRFAGALAGDRRDLPDRPRSGLPARTAGSSAPSGSRTTAGSTGSTIARSSPPPSGACGSGSTRPTCATASRCATRPRSTSTGRVELGADVTLEPNVILRGATRVGDGSTIGAGQRSSWIDDRRPARAGLGQHRRVVDDRGRGDGRAVQPPAAGQRRRAGRRGRQLRRAQEHAPRRRTRSSTT